MKQRKKNYRAPLTSKVYHESKKEKTYTLNNKKTAFLKLCTKFSNPGFKHQFLSNYPNIMKGKNFKSLELGGNESKKSREISGKNPIIIKRFLTQQPSDCWHSLLVSHKKQPEKEKKKNKCWREHLRMCGGQMRSSPGPRGGLGRARESATCPHPQGASSTGRKTSPPTRELKTRTVNRPLQWNLEL